MDMREEFEDLLDQYWDIAYSEGHLWLDTDHEGKAGEIRSKLSGLLPKTGDGSKAEPADDLLVVEIDRFTGAVKLCGDGVRHLKQGQQLYTHPAPTAQDSKGLEGWKLVPIDPTDEMIDAAHEITGPVGEGFGSDHADHYRAMLSAAPSIAEKNDE